MVVTRRAPAPPVPTSRTNSAQVIPRVKGRPQSVHDTPSPLQNGAAKEGDAKDVAAKDEVCSSGVKSLFNLNLNVHRVTAITEESKGKMEEQS
jgi:hypothetical protein